ncbi:hypothetical protein BDV96DRAFT_106273 [Lophiotrema nucula]|uniref:TLC domain-containing protein n=1 Tax=Lophiotrema nucula TaxID=690887 RepID=A0A6A5Z3M1_9PLEO|nr:hypothetical protein BDV96DRAFT_106273 [Lophiotrema nucula]
MLPQTLMACSVLVFRSSAVIWDVPAMAKSPLVELVCLMFIRLGLYTYAWSVGISLILDELQLHRRSRLYKDAEPLS